MKRILPLIVLSLLMIDVLAQQPNPCGTTSGRSEWLKRYQLNPELYQRDSDTLLLVPITLHIVGDDEGDGYIRGTNLFDGLCRLNEDFEPANIQFYLSDVRFINNSAYYTHETVLEGAYMMFAENVENTINCYVVADPAGNAGYNLPYAGIAMGKSSVSSFSSTWAHEVGHNLSLPHPFLGWEGGYGIDGSTVNYNNPAPETVTYDYTFFQDQLYEDTLIVDTAIVELVDGSNCQVAADGFCDTHPDYLATRWNCGATDSSQVIQKDPMGVSFRSDGTLIMSYSDDACANRFTEEQIAAMRANLYDEKPELIENQIEGLPLAGTPTEAISPQIGETVQFDDVLLEWEEVENADYYVVQISFLPNFPGPLTDEFLTVDGNNIAIGSLFNDRTYYWKVQAYNSHTFCTEVSDVFEFETADLVATTEFENVLEASILPNPAQQGNEILIVSKSSQNKVIDLQLFDISGSLLFETNTQLVAGTTTWTLPGSAALPAGTYILRMQSGDAFLSKRLVVQ